jgi:sialate O-acetylesterase
MKKLMITLGMFATFCTTEAKVTLPALFTDNMVLQQKSDIILRGHSTNRKEVMVITGWDKHIYMAQTDKQGNWKTEISTPSAGGPYEISFCDGEELTLHNIMIGELWLCSGQSNMEMPVGDWGKVLNYENEIREATYPDIRLFKVKKETSLTPKEDLSPTQGEWQECTPQSVNSFSAVGYFFARQLQQKLKTPIGVIDCSWGGTPAEAWTSYNGLKHLQEFEHEMDMLESLGFQPEKIDAEYAKKREAWYQALYEHDMGWCDDHQVWAEPDYSDENWKEMNLPGSWESNGIKDFDGVMWFRKTVDIPRTWYRKPITINLGKISDEDIVYYNGVEIGRGSNRDAVRRYTVPKKLVKRGKAVLTVRVTNYAGEGGLIGKPGNMTMTVKGKDPVALAGNWKYLSGFSLAGIEPLPPSPKTNPQYPLPSSMQWYTPLPKFLSGESFGIREKPM